MSGFGVEVKSGSIRRSSVTVVVSASGGSIGRSSVTVSGSGTVGSISSQAKAAKSKRRKKREGKNRLSVRKYNLGREGQGTGGGDKRDKLNRYDKLTEIVSVLLLEVDAFPKHRLVPRRNAP